MIHYVFTFRNKVAQYYDQPFFSKEDKEHVKENYARACLLSKPEEHAKLKEMALYYFGTFDDIKGTFDLVPEEKLLDLEDYIKGGE